MTFILAASGKKQSGKDTLLNGIRPLLEARGVVKSYSFADELKKFLVTGMGLRHEQVWGTDADKNTLTEYNWEDMPKFIRWDFNGRWYRKPDGTEAQLENTDTALGKVDTAVGTETAFWYLSYRADHQPTRLKTGKMTARELMQVFGTDIMRRMFSDRIWVNSFFRAVERDKPDVALIPDMRFPSELTPLVEGGAHIIRLMRDIGSKDQHPSETALDGWDWSPYERALVIPADATIESCRQTATDWLTKRLPEIPLPRYERDLSSLAQVVCHRSAVPDDSKI